MTHVPCLVISLDFELRWGSRDRFGLDPDAYRANLEGVAEVVPALLELFASRGIRATWATVGALACRDWEEYFSRAPALPAGLDRSFRVDGAYANVDPSGRLHFAPALVERVARTPGQELGTHTFSHVPFGEPGMTAEAVAADLAAVAALWTERFGAPPRSLVFPRNQVAHVGAVRAAGIRIWRENPPVWFHQADPRRANAAVTRAFRLIDDLVPRSAPTPPLSGEVTTASLFLRADLNEALWRLFVRRVRRTLETLEPSAVFHVYWHPHNLGDAPRRRLARVTEVLDLAAERIARGALVSRSMADLATSTSASIAA
jgi:peptidoglycan/xylan/chitin deacetylase (PgdA/CDA1 family)